MALALASVVAGAAAGWIAVTWLGGSSNHIGSLNTSREDAANREKRSIDEARTSPTEGPRDSRLPSDSSTAPTAAGVSPATAMPRSLEVTRQSGLIRIAASNAALADATRALARATHTHVKGGEWLASVASPITLNWQGTDIAAAWDALLGRVASIAVSCSGTTCELWIVAATPRMAGGSSTDGTRATSESAQTPRATAQMHPETEQPSRSPQPQPQPQSQPPSEGDSETN